MRSLFGFVCVLGLAAFGCANSNGSGGAAGPGGGGMGGDAGRGGTAGAGGEPVPCQATSERCESGIIELHEACCEQVVPEQANACDGSESLENPATCTPSGSPITYRLTRMEVEGDCNVGYDLDGCEGESCVPSGLTSAEGLRGVDNALGGFGPIAAGVNGNLEDLNKALSDALCGLREGGLCEGGADDGDVCNRDDQCAGTEASCVKGDCRVETPPVEIRFVIDANAAEGCANVTVPTDDEPSAHILNLSDDGCLSGALGRIPVPLPVPLVAENAAFANTIVRMTVTPAGFSHGLLGATMDADTVWGVLGEVLPIAAAATPVFDINASTPPAINASAACNGLSATLRIGGIAE